MSDTAALTRRQQDILARLREREAAGAPAPSLDELCADLGLRSRGSMHAQIKALVLAGEVEPMNGRQRGVRLRQPTHATALRLPLLGTIAAGRPIEAVSVPEWVEVPAALGTMAECFVLRVRGDSMIDDGILDGDWVVVERRAQARNGEIVVALIDENEATLKHIYQRPGEVRLIPANERIEPLVLAPERVRIQGVVVGQMRSYRGA